MQRIGGARYQTNWRSRVIVRKGSVEPGTITEIMKNGICMQFSESLEVGKKISVEFFVYYNGGDRRIRAVMEVHNCIFRSEVDGVELDLEVKEISEDELHMFNNVLQLYEYGQHT